MQPGWLFKSHHSKAYQILWDVTMDSWAEMPVCSYQIVPGWRASTSHPKVWHSIEAMTNLILYTNFLISDSKSLFFDNIRCFIICFFKIHSTGNLCSIIHCSEFWIVTSIYQKFCHVKIENNFGVIKMSSHNSETVPYLHDESQARISDI